MITYCTHDLTPDNNNNAETKLQTGNPKITLLEISVVIRKHKYTKETYFEVNDTGYVKGLTAGRMSTCTGYYTSVIPCQQHKYVLTVTLFTK